MRRFRSRLVVGNIALLCLTLLIGGIAIVMLHVTTTRLERVGRGLATDLLALERLRFRAEHTVSTSRGYLLTGHEQSARRFVAAVEQVDESLDALDRLGAHFAPVEVAVREYVLYAREAVARRAVAGDREDIMPFFESVVAPARDRLDAVLSRFVELSREAFDEASRDSRGLATTTQRVVLAATLVGFALGLVLAIASIRRLNALYAAEVEAGDVARGAVATRDEVLAIVSHDLRAPLQAITLAVSDVRDHEDLGRRIGMVERATARMDALIERLLDLGRLDGGNFAVRRERFEVGQVMDIVRALFEARAAARGVLLTTATSSDLVAEADREGLLQVLSNLVGNALKYTPDGGRIGVVASSTEKVVRFEVSDTGPGIAESEHERVFQRYWRGAPGGLGLGLYICRQIVRAHGGEIGVRSGDGGSTFSFTLPTTETS